MNIRRAIVVLALCVSPVEAYAAPFTLNFSGQGLSVAGEFLNGVPVSAAMQEFAPLFLTGPTITGSISYDTSQLDVDPDPNTGTYRIGALSVNIPGGLSASRSSSSMQISAFNDANNASNDEFFAYVDGVDSFSNSWGLPNPTSFWVALYGSTSMLVNDQLPTSPLNWTFGNASFNFMGSDNTQRQVLLTFSPVTDTPVPEPATLALLATGLAGLRFARRRRRP